jgi:hypothetical protein
MFSTSIPLEKIVMSSTHGSCAMSSLIQSLPCLPGGFAAGFFDFSDSRVEVVRGFLIYLIVIGLPSYIATTSPF